MFHRIFGHHLQSGYPEMPIFQYVYAATLAVIVRFLLRWLEVFSLTCMYAYVMDSRRSSGYESTCRLIIIHVVIYAHIAYYYHYYLHCCADGILFIFYRWLITNKNVSCSCCCCCWPSLHRHTVTVYDRYEIYAALGCVWII